jgi:hypothetical protein
VPEDRFGDLGGASPEPGGTRAGDKFAELDRTDPEPGPPPRPARPRGRYTWVVGVAAVIAIAVASINSLQHVGGGKGGPPPGRPLPRFAAAAVPGPIDGRANLNQSPSDPAPGDHAACSVTLAHLVRNCPPFTQATVITFIVPVKSCEGYLDRIQRISGEFPRVRFVGVISGAKQPKAAALVRDHGWRFPVALDPDGGLLTLYRVSLCATSVFARPGGTVRSTKIEAQRWSDATLRNVIAATAAGR